MKRSKVRGHLPTKSNTLEHLGIKIKVLSDPTVHSLNIPILDSGAHDEIKPEACMSVSGDVPTDSPAIWGVSESGENVAFKLLCRTCANAHSDMIDIFSEPGQQMQLASKLKITFSIVVCEEDQLPLQMCKSCTLKLEDAYDFKTHYQNSESLLISLLQGQQISTSDDIDQPFVIKNIDEDVYEETLEMDFCNEDSLASDDDAVTNLQDHSFFCCEMELTTVKEYVEHCESSHCTKLKICSRCTVSFDSKKLFLDHMEELHSQSAEEKRLVIKQSKELLNSFQKKKQQKCKFCEKTFSTYLERRRHTAIHYKRLRKCEKCEYKTTDLDALREHRSTHRTGAQRKRKNIGDKTLKTLFQCQYCDYISQDNKLFNSHLRKQHHDLMPKFQCEECQKIFYDKKAFGCHVREVHNKQLHLCEHCGMSFRSRLVMLRHSYTHSGMSGKMECAICDKYVTLGSFEYHMNRHLGVRLFKCDICHDTFDRLSLYNQHMGMHEKGKTPFRCELCLATVSKYSIKKHRERMHQNGDGHYCCVICQDVFIMYNVFVTHIKEAHTTAEYAEMHSKPRIYGCINCQQKFASNEDLQAHQCDKCIKMKSVEDILKCNFCEMCSADVQSYIAHRQSHPEAFRKKCQYCDKRFRNYEVWKGHEAMHRGQKPYVCENCPATFINRIKLRNHILTEHGGATKKFICDICKKSFAEYNKLEKHVSCHNKQYSCSFCNKMFTKIFSYQKHTMNCHLV